MVGVIKDVSAVAGLEVVVVWSTVTSDDCTEGIGGYTVTGVYMCVCTCRCIVGLSVEVDRPFGYSARVELLADGNVKAIRAGHGGSDVVDQMGQTDLQ